ncbi:MAG: protein-tyrosine kinase [Oleiphilaceae bacterium]|jgi:exopolysaccharide/PEP-CTERM locus tyrosine autokinase
MKDLNNLKALNKNTTTLDTSAVIDKMGEVDRFSIEELDRLKLISGSMQNSKILNVFRELRTQLIKTSQKKNFVCMVTSAFSKGGASYIATNLASVFALDKSKTSLLIDANLYAPSLERLIIGDSNAGMTDYLSDNSLSIKDVVYATGIPRLRVIPVGDNNEGAAEYFSSNKMLEFIDEVRTRYADRYIFIDSPPVSESSEARILSEIADMVILVVPHGGGSYEQIETAIQIIGKDKLTGIVYNN